jgi:hypothetical protein
MNNQAIENQQCEAVTPPPFRENEQRQDLPAQEPATSPTLAERMASLDLDEETAAAIERLTSGLDPTTVTADLLETLARGISHDNDVANADAAGYLRGRNEKIEAVIHPEPDDEPAQPHPVFPRYCRRSIWD